MPSRRQAHCRRRRGTHSAMRQGTVPNQGPSSSEGPSDSAKSQKAQAPLKARKP